MALQTVLNPHTQLPDYIGPFSASGGSATAATLGSELVTNGTFTGAATGWTATNWSYAANKVSHNTGNVSALSQSISIVLNTVYLVQWEVTAWTAGSFTITIGGTEITGYSTIETQTTGVSRGKYVGGSTGSLTLAFTPSSDCDVTLDNISVKAITTEASILASLKDPDGTNFLEYRGDDSLHNLFLSTSGGRYTTGDLNGYGVDNTALGRGALANNLTGYTNLAIGSGALNANGTGYANTALGAETLLSNTSGFQNIAIGNGCLRSNTVGAYQIAIGNNALYANTSGISCVAIGQNALYYSNTNYNIAIGSNVLGGASFTGTHNDGIGIDSQTDCTTGRYNESHGYESLKLNTTGDGNVAIGHQALRDKVTGSHNTALGYQAANGQTAGARNIAIGYQAALPSLTGDDQLNIGNTIYGNLATDQIVIGATAVVASALFALVSTTLGFLPPKMTETQRDAISSPTPGLIVFNTTSNKLNLRGGAGWEVITSV